MDAGLKQLKVISRGEDGSWKRVSVSAFNRLPSFPKKDKLKIIKGTNINNFDSHVILKDLYLSERCVYE